MMTKTELRQAIEQLLIDNSDIDRKIRFANKTREHTPSYYNLEMKEAESLVRQQREKTEKLIERIAAEGVSQDNWQNQGAALRAFRTAIKQRVNYECPAVQNAIDRLFKSFADKRAGFFEFSPSWDNAEFVNFLLFQATDKDLQLVTGRSRDSWLEWAN